jgi:hypothetical protein
MSGKDNEPICAVQNCKNKAGKTKFNALIIMNGKETAVTTHVCDPCAKLLLEDTLTHVSVGESHAD